MLFRIQFLFMKILLLITLLFAIVFPVNADSSLYERGRAYFYGDGVEQDYEKALLALSLIHI